jgi:hypothetical protein
VFLFPGRLKQQLEELQAVTKLVFPLDYVYVFRIFHDQNLLVYISFNQPEQSALERAITCLYH